MRKYVLSLLLLLMVSAAFSQKKSKVNLISSSRSNGDKRNGVDIIKVYNGVWQQDFSKMRSDSAYFYPSANAFEAFGHVNINQGDTLNIYSDHLNYDGNTKTAVLTDNVKMIDRDATLTTNHFVYNTATRIGTYTEGGKIVNKDNTLTSKNGYYFAYSRDAYFRYNVICVTTDAVIKTDTMRYNSKTRINYFYGPTHIYGAKDKDTLYTEDGTYNTNTEQAAFGKKNLYSQGTKTLKGDSLFYDRLKGYGRAVKHVIFNDNEQKVSIRGNLGTFFKKDDLTIMTDDPYVVLITEEKDTTKKDSANHHLVTQVKKTDSLKKQAASATKGVVKGKAPQLDSKSIPAISNLPVANDVIDSLNNKIATADVGSLANRLPVPITRANIDTAKKIALEQSKKLDKATQKRLKAAAKGALTGKIDTNSIAKSSPIKIKPDTSNIKRDSVYMSADTIETRILTYKELKTIQEEERLSHQVDTSKNGKKKPTVYKKLPKYIELVAPKWPRDTSYFHSNYFGPPKPKYVKPQKPKASSTAKKNVKIDSTFLDRPIVLQDTARVRIIKAFHSAKIFKSDLQAKADSIFYSNSDSTIRCYSKPMIWTQGSQLSGDTIYMRMRNKKLYNMDLFPSAFIVNLEKKDSTHFNQTGGKKMRGVFKDSKLNWVYVDGNAETIFFAHDSTTNEVTDMQRSSSSRLRIHLKNNDATDIAFLTKPDHHILPINLVKEDDKILKGFLWKPKDRPVSKESIIPSYNKKRDTTRKGAGTSPTKKTVKGKGVKGAPVITKPGVTSAAQDSTLKKAQGITAPKDTTLKNAPVIKTPRDTTLKIPPGIKAKIDSALKKPPLKPATPAPAKDTSKMKIPALSPAVQAKKDTTKE